MAYIITEPCVGVKDAACVEVCPVDCIYAKDEDDMYYIHPDECIDCGACLPECPVDAIIAPDESPDPVWLADNAAFFAEPLPGRDEALGSPGGADGTGPAGTDTPLVATWEKT
jgi:NAD-dependent dihydropyrimidine dehydrogenase PreA subunit